MLVAAMVERDGIIAAYAVSLFLAVVSTVACTISLGVLLYYKMWRKFIYRLVLYAFISLIVLSLSTIFALIMTFISFSNLIPGGIAVALAVIIYGGLGATVLLVASINVCIYLMALHSYQFTYKSDLCLLASTFVYVIIIASLTIALNILFLNKDAFHYSVIIFTVIVILDLSFLVNVVFTILALVPLCGRAYGYNMCIKTAATIESHRKALKEIFPLFLLIFPSLFFAFFSSIQFAIISLDLSIISIIQHLYFSTAGLSFAIPFVIHLIFVRKKLRTRRRTQREPGDQHRTHHTTAYTGEGISETCITEYQLVSESEVDNRFLLQKSNQGQ